MQVNNSRTLFHFNRNPIQDSRNASTKQSNDTFVKDLTKFDKECNYSKLKMKKMNLKLSIETCHLY